MLWYNLIYVSSLLIKRNWRKNEKRFFMFSTLIFLHQKLTGMSADYGAGCEDESEKNSQNAFAIATENVCWLTKFPIHKIEFLAGQNSANKWRMAPSKKATSFTISSAFVRIMLICLSRDAKNDKMWRETFVRSVASWSESFTVRVGGASSTAVMFNSIKITFQTRSSLICYVLGPEYRQ